MKKVKVLKLGEVDYKQTWSFQERLNERLKFHKLKNRRNEYNPPFYPYNYLLSCSHPNVITLGKSGSANNLLLSEKQLTEQGVQFYKINRGGDITYHGPGQLVVYPILDLEHFFTDIHKYLRFLEEAVIKTIADYGLTGDRFPGYTGVWLEPNDRFNARKLCAMGIRCSRWVTMHGLALNVNTDLSFFEKIVPCGINDKKVSSMSLELGRKLDINEVEQKLIENISDMFNMELL